MQHEFPRRASRLIEPFRTQVGGQQLDGPSVFQTLALLMACVLCVVTEAAEHAPNIILIMADDMGYESLGCNGGTSYETPVFDRLATQGMQFTMCYSQPLCTPSRNKIMTGRSNARNYRAFGTLDSEEITFGTLMKNAGYHTAIAGKWQLTGSTKPGRPATWGTTPAACGFDESCMWAYEKELRPSDARDYFASFPGSRKKTSRFWNPAILENGRYRPTTMQDFGPDIYSAFLTDFIERHQSEPFFVYYPMALTHNPFVPTPHTPGLTDGVKLASNVKYFDDMIRYTGVIVKRMLDKLDELNLAENTLVIFTSDNGTHRSVVSHVGERVVVGGKGLPIDAGCHVPMLAWWKGRIAPGSASSDLIDFSDFLPTFAELGNTPLPNDRVLDGHSFVPILSGRQGKRDSVFVHYDKSPGSLAPQARRVRFAFDGRHKLYLDGQMFDISCDIEEERPLGTASNHTEIVAARQRLQKVLNSMPAWKPDNSFIDGEHDEFTQQRRQRLADWLNHSR